MLFTLLLFMLFIEYAIFLHYIKFLFSILLSMFIAVDLFWLTFFNYQCINH